VAAVAHLQAVQVAVPHLQDKAMPAVMVQGLTTQAAGAVEKRQQVRPLLRQQVAPVAQVIVHIQRGQVQQQQVAAGHIPAAVVVRLKLI
jgi:hypothetical protein